MRSGASVRVYTAAAMRIFISCKSAFVRCSRFHQKVQHREQPRIDPEICVCRICILLVYLIVDAQRNDARNFVAMFVPLCSEESLLLRISWKLWFRDAKNNFSQFASANASVYGMIVLPDGLDAFHVVGHLFFCFVRPLQLAAGNTLRAYFGVPCDLHIVLSQAGPPPENISTTREFINAKHESIFS
jgi:hypothetical protein